jgi:hypothetical protein
MFQKSPSSVQHDLFTSNQTLLSGKSLKMYDDQGAWHNEFRKQVTMRIDEEIFRPLYSQGKGSPNAPIRVLIAMMVLKEAQGLSDEKLFEDCRFNMLTRSAAGLLKVDDAVPTESTYYLFRKQVAEYAKQGNGNLFDLVFSQVSKNQSVEFDVSGKRVRMDSKLLGSNIAWLSRYELVHETLRLFYKQIKGSGDLGKATEGKLDGLLKLKGNKVVYTLSTEDVKARFAELGQVITEILPLFSNCQTPAYKTLEQVFEEQFEIGEDKTILARKKENISAKSIQSPHDTDCHYRDKDGNKVKGYSMNVTESCDDDKGLNLIGAIEVKPVSTSDVGFFGNGIKKSQEVFSDKTEDVHADGAYHSPSNQQFCVDNDVDLHLHAIQGAKGRYELVLLEDGSLSVFDTKTNTQVEATKIKGKKGIEKWRIKTPNGYRYFTQKDIDTALVRKKIEQEPIEVLQKRNNVEATIFQIGYHYPNAKSRYRGLHKHQMWANIRCLWVNFVRVLKYLGSLGEKTPSFEEMATKLLFVTALVSLFMQILKSQTIFRSKYGMIGFG